MKPILPTTEEAEAIRAGNRELLDRYYMSNYELVLTVSKDYCRKHDISANCRLFEDMAQECYLYFAGFKFESASAFVRSVKDICVFVRFGGERSYHQFRQGDTEILTILDEPATRERRHGGEVESFGETLESDFDMMKEIEPEESKTDEVFFALGEMMTPRQREAFERFYYTDMTAREIGEEMGISIDGAASLKNAYMRRLRERADEVLKRLWAIGYIAEQAAQAV